MWPQYTYLALSILGLGIIMAKHGEPQKPYNAIVSTIANCLVFFLLYMGGFFKGMM